MKWELLGMWNVSLPLASDAQLLIMNVLLPDVDFTDSKNSSHKDLHRDWSFFNVPSSVLRSSKVMSLRLKPKPSIGAHPWTHNHNNCALYVRRCSAELPHKDWYARVWQRPTTVRTHQPTWYTSVFARSPHANFRHYNTSMQTSEGLNYKPSGVCVCAAYICYYSRWSSCDTMCEFEECSDVAGLESTVTDGEGSGECPKPCHGHESMLTQYTCPHTSSSNAFVIISKTKETVEHAAVLALYISW